MAGKMERPARFVFEVFGGDLGFAKRYVVDLDKGVLYRDEEFVPTQEVVLGDVQRRRVSDALLKSRILTADPDPARVIGGTSYAILMYFAKGSVQKEWTNLNREIKGHVLADCLDRVMAEALETSS